MKTKDAFAFQDFDEQRILQRKYFSMIQFKEHFGIDTYSTDEQFLLSLKANDDKSINEYELQLHNIKSLDLALSLYLVHISNHATRLEKFSTALAVKIADAGIADKEINNRYRRTTQLRITYNKIYSQISELRKKANEQAKKFDKQILKLYRKRTAERLKQARLAKKITQTNVAFFAGIEQSSYSNYESGLREPSISMAARLAKVLDVDLDWLCG